jgi:hypothetical protein
MNSVIRATIIGLCGLTTSASAFIYEVKVLKKWDATRKRYHYFIGISDFHDKRHDATTSQVNAINRLLRQLPKEQTKVIVEDLSTENNCGRKACGRFFLNSRGGILGGLAQTCRSHNLSVDNVEYRYCRVIALGPLLHNLNADVATIPSLKGIRVREVLQETQATVDEIKRYNDGATLASWYASNLKELAAHIEKLKMARCETDSMADYVARHTTHSTRLKMLKYLLTFDSALLDVKMVHSVQANADKQRVVAFAGGTHIVRVVDMLKKMGYKEVYSTTPEYYREHALEKCVGSHITDGTFCVRPHAVSNEVFKKLVNLDSL